MTKSKVWRDNKDIREHGRSDQPTVYKQQPVSTRRWGCTRCPKTWKSEVRRFTCPYCLARDKEL